MKYLTATAAAVALSLAAAAPLHAGSVKAGNNNSVNAGNLVNVNISGILNDLDADIRDNLSDNVVQVPIGIAATVCELDVSVIRQQRDDTGSFTCNAMTTSQALTQQLKKG